MAAPRVVPVDRGILDTDYNPTGCHIGRSMTIADLAILSIYYLALALLAMYGAHRRTLVRLGRRLRRDRQSLDAADAQWPSMTVQLPLFNEPNVAARLLDAVAGMSYPGPLEIQVLDDSTDETSAIVERKIDELRAGGARVHHLRRLHRDGYKAGALAMGLAASDSELFAVFDADFVPPPGLLLAAVPNFADPEVGMVQARWDHLNRDESRLTSVQAAYLDGHFAVESAARFLSGRFFNFNGTAGIWRRAAIEEAGGWSASTLTEDLDLSYRAQLAGWRFVFLQDLPVPAELPGTLQGFQDQQFRWTKGSIQTARKLLPSLLRADLPLRVKSEAFFHLTGNMAYPLTLLVALLMVPAITIRQGFGLTWTLVFDSLLFLVSTGSVLQFFVEGQRLVGRRVSPGMLISLLSVGVGMAVRNATAVFEGLLTQAGHFQRTPKRGDTTVRRERRPRFPAGELVLTLFFTAAVVCFGLARQWLSIPFLLLFLGGFGYVTILALRERVSWASGA